MKSGSNTGTTARAGIGCATNAHCFAHRAGEAVQTDGTIARSESATKDGTAMQKNSQKKEVPPPQMDERGSGKEYGTKSL